jgi:hypothetical protein
VGGSSQHTFDPETGSIKGGLVTFTNSANGENLKAAPVEDVEKMKNGSGNLNWMASVYMRANEFIGYAHPVPSLSVTRQAKDALIQELDEPGGHQSLSEALRAESPPRGSYLAPLVLPCDMPDCNTGGGGMGGPLYGVSDASSSAMSWSGGVDQAECREGLRDAEPRGAHPYGESPREALLRAAMAMRASLPTEASSSEDDALAAGAAKRRRVAGSIN